MSEEMTDRVAKIVFEAHYDDLTGRDIKQMLFGNPDITFEQVKDAVDCGDCRDVALATEYRIARAILAALASLKPRLH